MALKGFFYLPTSHEVFLGLYFFPSFVGKLDNFEEIFFFPIAWSQKPSEVSSVNMKIFDLLLSRNRSTLELKFF